MVDKGEKLREWAYTSLPELSTKNPFSGFANAIFTLFPWNKSNASTIRPPCWEGKEVSALENTLCSCCPRRQALGLTKLKGKKKFFLKEKGKKRGNRELETMASFTNWHSLINSTSWFSGTHSKENFLCKRRLSFVWFKAIFESWWKLLPSFPDSQSIDTDCLLLANVSPCRRDLLWVLAAYLFPLALVSFLPLHCCYIRGSLGVSLRAPTNFPCPLSQSLMVRGRLPCCKVTVNFTQQSQGIRESLGFLGHWASPSALWSFPMHSLRAKTTVSHILFSALGTLGHMLLF